MSIDGYLSLVKLRAVSGRPSMAAVPTYTPISPPQLFQLESRLIPSYQLRLNEASGLSKVKLQLPDGRVVDVTVQRRQRAFVLLQAAEKTIANRSQPYTLTMSNGQRLDPELLAQRTIEELSIPNDSVITVAYK